MKTSAPFAPSPGSVALPAATAGPRLRDFIALTKPRLNALVVATTFGGFYLASSDGVDFARLANAVAGTWLVAASAAALNQVIEQKTDALMRRTRARPLPDGRLQPLPATSFAVLAGVLGLAQLWIGATPLASGVALVTLVTYVAIYTPLKRRTSAATLIGGIPGGLPPVIGWAAARGDLALEAWVLFAVVFLWQMPHFLAIAWMCRDDYARAGFPLLPVTEPDGRSTAAQAILYAAVLVPVSLLLTPLGVSGSVYFLTALLLGSAFLGLAIRFAQTRSRAAARHLFLGSVAYLPLVWTVMLLDSIG